MRHPPLRVSGRLVVTGLLVVHCVLGVCGCGGRGGVTQKPTFPVTGRVLMDGRPVADAVVILHPLDSEDAKPVLAYARTRADGTFEVSTYKLNDGAPAGRYVITVMKQDDQDGSHLLPPHYASPKSSGFRVEVTEAVNKIAPLRLVRQ